MYFRPLPKLTFWCALAFALLIGLGVWQVQRLHWKLGLIADVHNHLTAAPLTLKQVLALPPDKAQYHRVVLEGRFDNAKEAYVFTTGPDGGPVYHVLTPFLIGGGRALMVDRGFVPKARLDPASRAQGQLQGEQHIVGVWRTPDPPNLFTPSPNLSKRIWYSRDVTAMAGADHVKLVAPAVVEADATPNPGGWPKGGQTVISFPNRHLEYAITWFALAIGLLAIYLIYHSGQGRLGFGKRKLYH